MKKLFLFLSIALISLSAQANEIKWMTLSQAIEAQKKDPKPIFIDAYTTWCGPCKMLDQNTFSVKEVAAKINANYYPVKFNAEGEENITFNGKNFSNPSYDARRTGRNGMHEFTKHLGVPGYPTMVVISKDYSIEKTIVGYKTAEQLLQLL